MPALDKTRTAAHGEECRVSDRSSTIINRGGRAKSRTDAGIAPIDRPSFGEVHGRTGTVGEIHWDQGARLIFAAAQEPTPPYYYLGLAALVVALIVGVVWAYRSWEEAHEELDPATPDELLDAFRKARLEGDLDEEEFARVSRRLQDADPARQAGKEPDVGGLKSPRRGGT